MNSEADILPPSHYIRPIVATTFPRRYLYLDTEAWRYPDDSGETQTFRLACAQYESWSDRLQQWVLDPVEQFSSVVELWHWVDGHCYASKPTYLWCHNLGYDLRISQALLALPDQGWTFSVLRLDEDVAWAKAGRHRDGAQLTFVDTFSWYPMGLAKLGHELGVAKLDMPEEDQPDDVWFEYCARDVEVLRRVWAVTRDWVFDNDLGPFRPTGSACGWAIWRHSFMTHRILAHDRPELRQLEREAAYAGRAEAYRSGKHYDVYEFDYSHAYAAVAADCNLPVIPIWGSPRFESLDLLSEFCADHADEYDEGDHSDICDLAALVTASVDVKQDVTLPVLPYRHRTDEYPDGRVVWPVGAFTGTWWLDELMDAQTRDQLNSCTIHGVQLYHSAPALREWAEWIIGIIDSDTPLISRLAKSWARTLVGRFGMRYPKFVNTHTTPDEEHAHDLHAGWWLDADALERPRRTIKVGDQVFVCDATVDGHDTTPSVMSYIMTQTRRRLLQAIEAADPRTVLYCDTDGLVVTLHGAANLRAAHIPGLRQKGHYKSVTVLGPKQLLIDGQPRVSGLPKPKARNEDGSWQVEWFERTRHALEEGRADRVRVEYTSMYVTGRDGRRNPDGSPLVMGP